ncbi:enoyl-[acyl-carrier-protein] reductase [NADH] [Panacagrimonas perspica]|uniref:Enoyl-[acyl-carrier-protein] reductase [NADH] n=1 Tax=Panacagrimonas perspica TaxID=381431 RepID=A0A4R7P9Q2_9GAMM|nr:enoyl-ACP reductase [Panacagrimonas perspica]TDU30714.1 enoyl-[acyl-carrier-protein] reductase [NADH] [Panacagrimonas perspica]THD01542.1 enoyl-[acyl-carrier-protein] reductase [Panacagrimonas perspica]
MGFMAGKKALITGVASDRSIATGIAEAFKREGAELAFTYQGDRLKSRVEEFAASCGSKLVLPLDVSDDAQIDEVFKELKNQWGELDVLVHSIGFAPREQLAGKYLDSVTREGYRISHDISAYSFAALGKAARPLMAGRNASMLTLTYLGAVRAVPMYNVMGPAKASLEANVRFMAAELGELGIRVNGISAGPIKTLAAAGITGFRTMLNKAASASPLKRNVSIEEVGNAAAFLSSDLASGVTGEILYVDAGYNIMGMSFDE